MKELFIAKSNTQHINQSHPFFCLSYFPPTHAVLFGFIALTISFETHMVAFFAHQLHKL
jgi:hypothetical protein